MDGEDHGGADGRRRAPGELESEVLAALWSADGPLTAAQVNERLPGALAYTTVLTILSRLVDKGLVTRRKEGRGYAFAPARDEAAHTAGQMRSLLDHGSDREAVLSRFIDELSADDERLLQRLLGEHREP